MEGAALVIEWSRAPLILEADSAVAICHSAYSHAFDNGARSNRYLKSHSVHHNLNDASPTKQ